MSDQTIITARAEAAARNVERERAFQAGKSAGYTNGFNAGTAARTEALDMARRLGYARGRQDGADMALEAVLTALEDGGEQAVRTLIAALHSASQEDSDD